MYWLYDPGICRYAPCMRTLPERFNPPSTEADRQDFFEKYEGRGSKNFPVFGLDRSSAIAIIGFLQALMHT